MRLRAWAEAVSPAAYAAFRATSVRLTGDPAAPLALVRGGDRVAHLRCLFGEGNNSRAYLTPEGTILKVAKRADTMKKLLLQAWLGELLPGEGIACARTLRLEPGGLFLEQSWVAPPDVAERFGHLPQLPEDVASRLGAHFEVADRLARDRDMWLDMKAENYHLDEHGELVQFDQGLMLDEGAFRWLGQSWDERFTPEQRLLYCLHPDQRARS